MRQIRVGHSGAALLLTSAFSFVELALMIALLSLAFWFAPTGHEPDLAAALHRRRRARSSQFVVAVALCARHRFLEPFYVASGFAMYLNRRVELEAWDIEQEFRRAFASRRCCAQSALRCWR